ncbi:hypothetical protein P3342_010070 [Pyrenophora teres f. teres]|nr:hypothetical protein P3342_010070 [Pyrenophora teres f. teres]
MPSIAEQIIAGGPLRRLTLVAAAWFRYNKGIDDAGNAFKVDDPMVQELQAKAAEGPIAQLQIKNLFGDDLRLDKRFVQELTSALEGLEREGALAMIEKYA